MTYLTKVAKSYDIYIFIFPLIQTDLYRKKCEAELTLIAICDALKIRDHVHNTESELRDSYGGITILLLSV